MYFLWFSFIIFSSLAETDQNFYSNQTFSSFIWVNWSTRRRWKFENIQTIKSWSFFGDHILFVFSSYWCIFNFYSFRFTFIFFKYSNIWLIQSSPSVTKAYFFFCRIAITVSEYFWNMIKTNCIWYCSFPNKSFELVVYYITKDFLILLEWINFFHMH